MPAKKKDPSVRARRNKSATRATLSAVTTPTTTAADYADLTVVQLREEVGRRNRDGRVDMLDSTGKKAELVRTLVDDDSGVPAMPDHSDGRWHAQTVAWWRDVWTSPMAEQWDDSDLHNVFVVALLYNDIWTAGTPKERKDALAEYRLQRADLGLSPYSRRRLEWTIETAQEAQDRGARRRRRNEEEPATSGAQGDAPAAESGGAIPADPRAYLSLA